MATKFRALPSVDRVLSDERVQKLVDDYSRQAVLDLVREQLDGARDAIQAGQPAPDIDQVIETVRERAAAQWRTWPTPVINATGVILHTNLGRSPLSRDALAAIERASKSYSDLELDLDSGTRGSRSAYVSRLLCQLTGAEAAMAVNNNASAVLLGLAAIASGKEVIVSRGEAVEIGGGFRVPEVSRQSGATLVDVGTTNKTYARDYEAAISDNTGAILSVHASNFRVSGFTHTPRIEELAALGKAKKIPVLHDLGSGCLIDTSRFGLAHEPTPQESIAASVSLAFFSGDKLLGGPQAGIIAGDADMVERVSRHPLARAVRIDKLGLAALTATLLHYTKDEVEREIPIWAMIAMKAGDLEGRAGRWRESLGGPTSVVSGESTIGGGSLPGETLPTTLIAVDASTLEGGATGLASRLRHGDPPVVGRIEEERVLLDLRTVLAGEDDALLRVVRHALDVTEGEPKSNPSGRKRP